MDKDASSNFLLHILQVEPKPTYVRTYVDSYCKVTFYCALLLQEIYINNYCGHFPVFTYTEAFSSSPPPPTTKCNDLSGIHNVPRESAVLSENNSSWDTTNDSLAQELKIL